jgi:hypothetical protein
LLLSACVQVSREKTKAEDNEAALRSQIFALEDNIKQTNENREKEWEEKKDELLSGLEEEKKLAVETFVAGLFNIGTTSKEEEETKPSEATERHARFY